MLGRGMVEPVLPTVGIPVARLHPPRREPVGALPARGLAETRAGLGQARVQRRGTYVAARRVLPERPVHVVQQAERFGDALFEIAPTVLERQVPPHVHVPQVHGRMPVHDPLGQHLARAARGLDADRVEPRGHVEVPEFGRFAQMVAVVGRETLRPVQKQLDARGLQRRHTAHGFVEHVVQMLPVLGERAEGEIVRNGCPSPAPRLGVRLEKAGQNAADLLLEIRGAVRVAQRGQPGCESGHRLGHHVEMLRGVQRHVDSGQPPDLARPHPGAVDDGLRGYVAPIRRNAGHVPVALADAGHAHVLEDADAVQLGTFGVGLRRIGRIRLAVSGQIYRADQVLGVHQRPQFRRLARRNDLDLQTEALGHRRPALQFFEAFRVAGDGQRTGPFETRSLTGLGFEFLHQGGGVLGQPGQVARGPQLADQARGVPRRTAGQGLAFQEHHIGDAELA